METKKAKEKKKGNKSKTKVNKLSNDLVLELLTFPEGIDEEVDDVVQPRHDAFRLQTRKRALSSS